MPWPPLDHLGTWTPKGSGVGSGSRASETHPYFLCLAFLSSSSSAFFLLPSPSFSLPLSALSQLSSALLFDAVYAVVTAVQELNRSQEIGVKPLSCGSAQIWQHGTSLMNYLRMVRGGGAPGGHARPLGCVCGGEAAICGDPIQGIISHMCSLRTTRIHGEFVYKAVALEP